MDTALEDFRHHPHKAATSSLRIPITPASLRRKGHWNGLRQDPLRHLRALETACTKTATELSPDASKVDWKVSIVGPVGARASSPRELDATSLRQLVCVDGIATKVSHLKPKVLKSTHYCPETNKFEQRTHIDATDPQLGLKQINAATGEELPDKYVRVTTGVYPTVDGQGHLLETEFGLSEFKDHQTVTLQEMPERAPQGQLPRSVELILDNDLVDKVKPGDRIRVVGIYRALNSSAQGQRTTSGLFPTAVLVNSVHVLGRDSTSNNSMMQLQKSDLEQMEELAQRKNIVELLGKSLCPSIHGHERIKQAIVLQLLSGVEKNLANGTHLRGDINILMVGDPSTAKSQLLRAAMTVSPLSISTTGKGSSGVGLTAAVTSDPDTKERRLEAGAMVLADRGLVCIDEFDKMGESDRVAIHEVMEQQTVTIAKAGIHASLNARCSVLAAANPVYGQYERTKGVHANVGLPDSLLSRFDLLFVVLDEIDPELDRRIASHVLTGHCFKAVTGATVEEDEVDSEDEDDDYLGAVDKIKPIWTRQRYQDDDDDNEMTDEETVVDDHRHDVLHHDFLRKYLYYAKHRPQQPVLTDEASEWIALRYAHMRSRADERTVPVTARSLETIIRLATAHAKARLRDEVLEEDCIAALDLLQFALYQGQCPGMDLPVDMKSGMEQQEPPTKRARVEQSDNNESDEPTSSASEAPPCTAHIMETLDNGGGMMSLSELIVSYQEICLEENAEERVRTAVQVLETGGRIHVTEDQDVTLL